MADENGMTPIAGGSRRRFLAGVIAAIHAAIGGTLTIVLGGAVLSPGFVRRRENWLKAGLLADLPENQPTPVTIRVARDDGYARIAVRRVVFLVRTGDTEVTGLSSTCTHLGCRVSWDYEAAQLRCPCHGGAFDRTGAVAVGPPPAPLPRISTRVDGDHVFVQL